LKLPEIKEKADNTVDEAKTVDEVETNEILDTGKVECAVPKWKVKKAKEHIAEMITELKDEKQRIKWQQRLQNAGDSYSILDNIEADLEDLV